MGYGLARLYKLKRRLTQSPLVRVYQAAITLVLNYLTGVLLSKKRIDHGPMYICMMFWDLFAGTFAVVIGLPDAAMTHMSQYSTNLICWLMFIGGLACCYGITMGTKVDPAYWIRPLFGKTNRIDLRLPYMVGILGTPMLMLSFYYYSVAIFTNLDIEVNKTNASEASLAFMFGLACTLCFTQFCLEIRMINKRLPWLIAKEIDIQMAELVSDDNNVE